MLALILYVACFFVIFWMIDRMKESTLRRWHKGYIVLYVIGLALFTFRTGSQAAGRRFDCSYVTGQYGCERLGGMNG